MRVFLDEAGRIELPNSVRAQLGIKPGDELVLENIHGQWIIKSARRPLGLNWKGNVLVHEGTCAAPVDRIIEEIRTERLEELSEGLRQ